MTDRKPMYDDMDDLELLTSFLNGHLPADRAAAVRRRLEEDAEFRAFAEPLILAWKVPRDDERDEPESDEEWQKGWDAFVRRSGFPRIPYHGPRRRRWFFPLVQLLVLAGVIAAFLWLTPLRDYVASWDYRRPIPDDSGWIGLYDGIQVQLGPGASLRPVRALQDGRQQVLLEGTARFRAFGRDRDRLTPPGRFSVRTTVGEIIAAEADFTVTTRPDSTFVIVRPVPRDRFDPDHRSGVGAVARTGPHRGMLTVRPGEGAVMVRDRMPEQVPDTLAVRRRSGGGR